MASGKREKPVKISTYYESLCPYSQDFIVNQLYPTYQLVPEIMVAKMVPFGNADVCMFIWHHPNPGSDL